MIQIIQSFLGALKKPATEPAQRKEPSVGEEAPVHDDSPYAERTFDINDSETGSSQKSGAIESWSAAMARGNWLLVGNLVLSCALVLCLLKLFNQQPIVIVKPPVMTGEIRLEDGKPNTDWMLSWAVYAAYQLGNVNPRNVEFVAKVIMMMLAPNLQDGADRNIRRLVEVMRASSINQTFTADDVKFDDKSGLVWVIGNKTTRMVKAGNISEGIDGSSDDTRRWTFEFVIRMNHEGMPVITHIDQYSGLPDFQRADSVTPDGVVLEAPPKGKNKKAKTQETK